VSENTYTLELNKDSEILYVNNLTLDTIRAENPLRVIKTSVYINYLASKYLISKQKYTEFNLDLFLYFIVRYINVNRSGYLYYLYTINNGINKQNAYINLNIPDKFMKYFDKLEIKLREDTTDTGLSTLMQTIFTCIENDKKNNTQPSGT
jgi:hypothetical protein